MEIIVPSSKGGYAIVNELVLRTTRRPEPDTPLGFTEDLLIL